LKKAKKSKKIVIMKEGKTGMPENLLFFKIRKKWRSRAVRELLIELLCTKFNLELVESKRTKTSILCSDNMMIFIRGKIVDVMPIEELQQADKEYLNHLF
jgi:hypothetical protein